MKIADFIKLVREEGGYEKLDDAKKAIDSVIGSIEKVLKNRDGVTLGGFGTFDVAVQKGKTGKVPGTDRTYTTQDKYIPKFKAAKKLKETLASVEIEE